MTSTEAPVAVTMGEPAGIGPDITVTAWARRAELGLPPLLVIGDPDVLVRRASALGLDVTVECIGSPAAALALSGGTLPVLPLAAAAPVTAGTLDPRNAGLVLEAIERAVALALDGEVSAVVTNPIHKHVLYGAGFRHPGHTEFLAELARAAGREADPVMMLMAQGLRTVPVTIHIPLKDIPGALTAEAIVAQTRIVARDLARCFAIPRPRIAVTGLNPHAGENGSLGTEERDIIEPALERLRADGLDVRGPLPADTVFHEEARATYDVCMCMYHDQALIPVKMLGFHDGVNCTLGLPFLRTSPDHGTALALAGTGCANPSSLVAALTAARDMAAAVHRGSISAAGR